MFYGLAIYGKSVNLSTAIFFSNFNTLVIVKTNHIHMTYGIYLA